MQVIWIFRSDILAVLNEAPGKYLHCSSRGSPIFVNGVQMRVINNNVKGGIEILPGTEHFDWNKKVGVWF